MYRGPDREPVAQGDIVRVPIGRGWKIAKVAAVKAGGIIQVLFKDRSLRGKGMDEVRMDSVMTEDEVKQFQKNRGNTRIVRNNQENTLSEDNEEDEEGSTL